MGSRSSLYALVAVAIVMFIFMIIMQIPEPGRAPAPSREAPREIKALSNRQVDSYQSGTGMGLASAAELNGYPGPRHVLDLADSLHLSAYQAATAQELVERVRREAVELGERIVAQERRLDSLFVRGFADPTLLDTLVAEIARLNGKLRLVHLRAHLEMSAALSPPQLELYQRLRSSRANDATTAGASRAESPLP